MTLCSSSSKNADVVFSFFTTIIPRFLRFFFFDPISDDAEGSDEDEVDKYRSAAELPQAEELQVELAPPYLLLLATEAVPSTSTLSLSLLRRFLPFFTTAELVLVPHPILEWSVLCFLSWNQ
eukprot:PhM_4_TR12532/c0_g1_i1/m.24890